MPQHLPFALSDQPVVDSSSDRLDRQAFAKNLAHVIRHLDRDNSTVLALTGPWGSGKTSRSLNRNPVSGLKAETGSGRFRLTFLEISTQGMQDEIVDLREFKLRRIGTLALCDEFIESCTDEAVYGLSHSLFGRMRKIANFIDPAFEELDLQQAVNGQDRRLQPYLRSQLFIALVAELE